MTRVQIPVRALITPFLHIEDTAFLKNLKITHKSVMCSYPLRTPNVIMTVDVLDAQKLTDYFRLDHCFSRALSTDCHEPPL